MTQLSVPLEQFGKITVYDENSAIQSISTLWQEKTAALFFVRHFG